jgi:hypothetical protein
MFTIEMEDDETCITVMDETSELEDVQILLFDDYCHIRQFNEKYNDFEVVTLSAEMYLKVMEAWKLPEGAYVLDKKDKDEVY